MSAWVIKGRPSRNDLALMLAPGRTERWVTRKPPRTWAAGDLAFMWKGAPALCVLGVGEIVRVHHPDANGDSWFTLRYTTGPLDSPLGIEELRADPVLTRASFLKAGPAGTIFALTPAQASRLGKLVRRKNRVTIPLGNGVFENPGPRSSPGPRSPRIALSIRQPWAELVMRGIKTIEVRRVRTQKRERVLVYASLNRTHPDHEERVRREYHIDVDALPRGVLVGTVEIVDCRRIRSSDSAAAGFRIGRDTISFGWHLARPARARRLRAPRRQPQPMFFRPF